MVWRCLYIKCVNCGVFAFFCRFMAGNLICGENSKAVCILLWSIIARSKGHQTLSSAVVEFTIELIYG